MRIVRYIPNRRMPVRRAFRNRIAEQTTPSYWKPALDVVESDEAFVVKASLPGIDPENLSITLEEGVLTLEGERKPDESIKANDYRLRERVEGTFRRQLQFRTPVDAENVEAVYQHGVLSLTVPKEEVARPRKIAVQAK